MALANRASHRTISHLFLTGHNPFSPPSASSSSSPVRQSPLNPSLVRVPLATWLSQLGRGDPVEPESSASALRVTSIASSATGHSLLSFRDDDDVDRVLALGRNESGQLGIGFASQEGTRGLVEAFSGERVLKVATAVQSSFLLVKRDDDRNDLYSFGNCARGKLSQPTLSVDSHEDGGDRYDDGEPVQKVLSRATLVEPPALDRFGKIVDVVTGFEHLLVLTESGDIFGSGCNTDGQLGLGHANDVHSLTRLRVPDSFDVENREGGIDKVVAGGDSSGFITKSGKLFTWGNSEYAQAGHGRTLDQVLTPLVVDPTRFAPSNDHVRIIDYQCGGSFGLILDDRNNVYSVGYGALGYSHGSLSTSNSSVSPSPATPFSVNPTPTLIPSISSSALGQTSPITRIRARHGYAVAVSDATTTAAVADSRPASRVRGGALWSWGLNNEYGRLGLGTVSRQRQRQQQQQGGGGAIGIIGGKEEPWVVEPRRVEIPSLPPLSSFQSSLASGSNDGGPREEGWSIGEVELGDEGMWVEVRQRIEN